ncbi:class II glutamine amidotransferase [Gryllotalpicola koreensis]
MLAVLDTATAPARGDPELAQLTQDFIALSVLHADGWGVASRHQNRTEVRVGTDPAERGMGSVLASPASARLLYLRFASAGSAVKKRNLQPFVTDDVAFAHNGLLAPRSLMLATLSFDQRHDLRGDTDSEVYFAHVLRALLTRRRSRPAADTIAPIVAELRALYPEACLNALMLVSGELLAIHAPGTVGPPLAAFAARGAKALPPGHDADYNVLSTAVLPSGRRVVATSGIDVIDSHPLPRDAVSAFLPNGLTRSIAI